VISSVRRFITVYRPAAAVVDTSLLKTKQEEEEEVEYKATKSNRATRNKKTVIKQSGYPKNQPKPNHQ